MTNVLSKNISNLVISLFTLLLISSCVKEEIDLNKLGAQQWTPEFALPLAHSSLTIGDIISESGVNNITVDNTNFCTAIYKGELFSLRADELIQIPTQVYSKQVKLDANQIATLTGTAGTITIPFTQTISFNSGTGGPLIDSLFYKSGILTDSIYSEFKQNATITISIPSAKKAGIAFTKTLNLTYTGTIPVISKSIIDLSGYKFDMTAGGSQQSKFDINYSVKINYSGSNPPTTNEKINITQTCPNPKFNKIFGYIGQQSLISPGDDQDTVGIEAFKNAITSTAISIKNPEIKFIFNNSFGASVKCDILQLSTYSPPAAQIAVATTSKTIASPANTAVGSIKKDSVIFNTTNSGIEAAINSSPKDFIYKIAGQSNPPPSSPITTKNFILDTSRFSVNMEVKLPLWGKISNLVIMDTIKDFKLNLDNKDSLIQQLTIRTIINNGFPANIGVQVYFTDSLYNKLDSLIAPYQIIMQSATVNPTTGKVTSPTQKIVDSSFDIARYQKLVKTRRIIIKGNLSTFNNGGTDVKIYSDYRLDVKLSAKAKLNVKIKK